MGFGVTVKVSVPKQKFGNKKWLDEIARTQRQTSVPRLRKLFQQTVFGWSKKPDFGWNQVRSSDYMSIQMYATGPNADIWNLVDSGSPPHEITPKGKFLSFRPGYKSATRPGQLMSGRAYRSGKQTRAMIVHHPGFQAREFTRLIADAYENPYIGDIQDAINRVARS